MGPLRPLGWAAFAFLVYGPLAAALFDACTGASVDLLSARRADLLGASLLFSASVAVLAMALGTAAALWLARHGEPLIRAGTGPLLATLAIPPTVYALAWSHAFAWLGVGGLSSGPWLIAGAAETLSYLPAATGFALAALQAADGELLQAGRLYRSATSVLARIVLPLARPALAGAAALIFLLSLLDYTIPSIFGVNVYALEIFVGFSASYRSADAVLLAAPLIVLAGAAATIAVSSLRQVGQRTVGNELPRLLRELPNLGQGILALAAASLMLAIAAPAVGLMPGLTDPDYLLQTLHGAGPEIGYSFATSAAAALLALLLALIPALELANRRALWLWLLVLVPVSVPPALSGVGLIVFWASIDRLPVYGTPWMTVAAEVARYAPVAAGLLAVAFRRIDSGLVDAALVSGNGWRAIWRRALLPLARPGMLLVAGASFALALGELGAAVLVMPPGHNTLTVKTYNYLHYGGTPAAAGLCLAQFALALLGMFLAAMPAWRWRKAIPS
ncbi:ABC transporter permease [Thiocystis violacea]|uniref:ABC transporter permease n=1 Tax=Thiocystis violacea TaxID=13725 RepID=UPI001906716B|nr:ABC transporter permease subunit [Thiocystis violacea]